MLPLLEGVVWCVPSCNIAFQFALQYVKLPVYFAPPVRQGNSFNTAKIADTLAARRPNVGGGGSTS